jgi:O-antigen/teichoic acid export membrane protein
MRNKYSINSIFSISQSIVVGLTYLFLYKILLKKVGVNELGMWALAISFSATINLVSLGMGNCITRFIAECNILNDTFGMSKVIFNSFLIVSVLYIFAGTVIYIIGSVYINYTFKYVEQSIIYKLLFYSIIYLIINALSNIFLSCFDGIKFNFIKSLILITSSVFFISLVILFINIFGLLGVIFAQILQYLFVLFVAAFVLQKWFIKYTISHNLLDWNLIKKILKFGLREQTISVAQLFFDPITKILLSKYGNFSFVAIYEISNRIITQLKSLIASLIQMTIPYYVEKNSTNKKSFNEFYLINLKLTFNIGIIWLYVCYILSYFISYYYFDNLNLIFFKITFLIMLANLLNIFSLPSYFSNISRASFRSNIISNWVIAVFNLFLGFILGLLFNSYGIVIAWVIAFSVGSLFVIFAYHYNEELNPNYKSFLKQLLFLLFNFVIISLSFYLIYNKINYPYNYYYLIFVILLLLFYNINIFLKNFKKFNISIHN